MSIKSLMAIESFLYGRLSEEETCLFFDKLSSDKKLFSDYCKETVFESQVYSMCRNHPEIKGLESEDGWKLLIENSVEHRKVINFVERKKRNRFSYSLLRYLIAACLICAALTSVFILTNKTDVAGIESLAANTQHNKNNQIQAVETFACSTDGDTHAVSTDKGRNLLRIGPGTACIMAESSKLTVAKKDTSVYLDVSAGSMLFSVEKGRYRSFTVVTPNARIRVTGTVFRVDAVDGFTKVSVIQGSVEVYHKSGLTDVRLQKGNVALADSSMVTFYKSEDEFIDDFPERKFLDSFLKQSIGMANGYNGAALNSNYDDTLKYHLLKADAVIDSFVNRNKGSRLSDDLQRSRQSERNGKYIDALNSGCNDLLGSGYDKNTILSVIFRCGAMSLLTRDTAGCLIQWEKYLENDISGLFDEIVTVFMINYKIRKGTFNETDRLMKIIRDRMRAYPLNERALFGIAETFRLHGEYESALNWYELIVDFKPESEIRKNATYWMAWSLIQMKMPKIEKRAISIKPLQIE